jgi:hypothetical protein
VAGGVDGDFYLSIKESVKKRCKGLLALNFFIWNQIVGCEVMLVKSVSVRFVNNRNNLNDINSIIISL